MTQVLILANTEIIQLKFWRKI